jgi:hypothetical protein
MRRRSIPMVTFPISRRSTSKSDGNVRRFSCKKREAGHTLSAIFQAFMNMYMSVGAQAIGALNLAERIEDWDPEQQAKLRQVGLRSSFELDDEEGDVFIALSADHYPMGVMGRRNAVGDLFVSKMVSFPDGNFATAVDKIKQSGAGLIVGSEAKDLTCKMEQVKGVAPRADKKIKEIWQIENWGEDEWAEQILAEIAFSKAMNVEYVFDFDRSKLCGSIAGYRVRRAPNGLVLVPSDSDDDIFVAVATQKERQTFWDGCADRKGSSHSSIRRIAGSFPRKPCTIWKSSPAKKDSRQCHRFKNCRPERWLRQSDAPGHF